MFSDLGFYMASCSYLYIQRGVENGCLRTARNQIATKPSQRFGTPAVECRRGGDVRKYASAEEILDFGLQLSVCVDGIIEGKATE